MDRGGTRLCSASSCPGGAAASGHTSTSRLTARNSMSRTAPVRSLSGPAMESAVMRDAQSADSRTTCTRIQDGHSVVSEKHNATVRQPRPH